MLAAYVGVKPTTSRLKNKYISYYINRPFHLLNLLVN